MQTKPATTSAAAPTPVPNAAGKRKTHPTGSSQPSKALKHPTRKSLQDIKYNELVCPPFPTEYDDEDFPFKVDGKDYFWLVSDKATKYYESMCKASDNCCADMWDVYIYNDFTGYGEIELLENVVNAFHTEWKKTHGRKSEELFWRIEGLALFLFSNPGQWGMCDDGDRVITLQHLLASMFLETFILIKNDNLLTNDSPLKNIGFVAAVIANYECDDRNKLRKIVNMCKDAGIRVALGPEEFEHDDGINLEEFAAGANDEDEDENEDEDEDEDDENEDEDDDEVNEGGSKATEDGGFEKTFRRYLNIVGSKKIGGHEFDLSKWSKTELKRHAFGSGLDDGGLDFMF